MSSTTPCPRCGNIIPEDTPKDVCPVCCLLDLGLGSPNSQEGDEAESVPGVEIGTSVGSGSFGQVFEGIELHGGYRRVAIKILHEDHSGSAQRARFLEEMQILARLDHPHLVTLYRSGRTSRGNPFYIMELVEGAALDDWAAKASPSHKIEILIQITRALAYAHQKGVAHRDLKPTNILVTNDPSQAKIIDFGIARAFDSPSAWGRDATINGQRIGTPRYMSPEQLAGDPNVDLRTDIWSLGLLIYELFLGQPVLSGLINSQYSWEENSAQLRSFAFPKLPDRELDWIARKACSLTPADRYQTGQELLHDLEAKQAGGAVSVGLSYPSYRFRKSLSRHRLAYTIAAALSLLVFTLAAGGWLLSLQEKKARQSVSQSLDREKKQHQKTLAAEAEIRRSSSDSALLASTRAIDTGNYREARQSLQQSLILWPENSAARFALNFLNATLPEATLQSELSLSFTPVNASPHPETGYLILDPQGKTHHLSLRQLKPSTLPLTPIPTTDPDLKLRFTQPAPGLLEVRDLESDIPILTPLLFGSGPEKVIYSPRDRTILVIGRGTSTQLWNLDRLRQGHHSTRFKITPRWLEFYQDTFGLIVANEKKEIWSWIIDQEPEYNAQWPFVQLDYDHWQTGENHHHGTNDQYSNAIAYLQMASWLLNPKAPHVIFAARARQIRDLLVARTDGSLWLQQGTSGYKKILSGRPHFTTAAISATGETAARISDTTHLEIINLASRDVTASWTLPHPALDLTILSSKHLAITHPNGTMTIWNPQNPDTPKLTIPVTSSVSGGFHIRSVPGKPEVLVTLDGDIAIRHYSTATGQMLAAPLRHQKGIHWMFVTGIPDILVTIDQKETGPGSIRIWSIRLAREIIPPLHHPARIHWATTIAQGSQIATACDDNIVRRWILEDAKNPIKK